MSNAIYEKFKNISDEQWLELLIRAEKEPVIDGITMPGFPDYNFQLATVGSAGADNLRYEAYHTVKRVKKYAGNLGIKINDDTKILDFGVGWGRMIRFFFKDLPSENLYGSDTLQKMINICKELLPSGRYSHNNPRPPINFPDNTFDIVYAYSVFSHLRADVAEEWIMEFSRILKPNGVLYATVRGYEFLNSLDAIQNDSKMREQSKYYLKLFEHTKKSVDEYRNDYENNEFIYFPTGGGEELDSSFFGDCIVPEKYIVDVFGKYLLFKDFNQYYDNNKLLPQAYFVMQKRAE